LKKDKQDENKQITELNCRLNRTNDSKNDQSGKVLHVMRTRVLSRPIVFLRVRCSFCVRCSILILLIKTVRCSIPHFTLKQVMTDSSRISKRQ